MSGGVAFFDLDRTLLDVNSGHLWLAAEWRRGRVGVTTVARAIVMFTRYAFGRLNLDDALDEATALYAGDTVRDTELTVQAWFDAELSHRLRPGARAALASHRADGDALVLATTASQFVAANARRAFDLDDVVATELDIVDGVLTGKVATHAHGVHKRDRCLEWAAARGISAEACSFYTDSITDLPLLEAVGRPVVVHPDVPLRREAARRGWPVVDWGVSAKG